MKFYNLITQAANATISVAVCNYDFICSVQVTEIKLLTLFECEFWFSYISIDKVEVYDQFSSGQLDLGWRTDITDVRIDNELWHSTHWSVSWIKFHVLCISELWLTSRFGESTEMCKTYLVGLVYHCSMGVNFQFSILSCNSHFLFNCVIGVSQL